MKKGKMKKLLAVLLSLVMLTSFAACGEGENSKKDNGKAATESNNSINKINKDTKIGDYVHFGSYEQDNNISNGKENIEWLVLDVKDGKVLVTSKYALDAKPYNEENAGVTWENCTLRKWLNNEFMNTAFTSEEKAKILTVTVSADANPSYSTDPGNATQDKVYLLSIKDAYAYFTSHIQRQCEPTKYAVANGAYTNDGGNCFWWLRTPGDFQYRTAFILDGGYVFEFGSSAYGTYTAVRPVMWVTVG